MGNKVTVNKGAYAEEFDDVLGHQIGNGCIVVLTRDGNQKIVFSPDDVTIELDEEATKKFVDDLDKMEAEAIESSKEEVPQAANDSPVLEVVPDTKEESPEKDNSPAETVTQH